MVLKLLARWRYSLESFRDLFFGFPEVTVPDYIMSEVLTNFGKTSIYNLEIS